MEDAHIGFIGLKETKDDGTVVINNDHALFGVFDGHGGEQPYMGQQICYAFDL